MDNLRVCFLGTGSMGSAVLRGLIDSGHPIELISATTKSEQSATSLRAMGVSALSVEQSPDANALLSGDADVVVLGVKPYQIVDVLTEIAEELPKNSVVISMAGGIELETMAAALPEHKNLIRSMPNTPAMVGQAVTGLAPHSTASADALDAAQWLFSSVGEVVKVKEEQINALSAISGSGPAWIYFIIEHWEKVAISKGFTQEQAETLVRSTLFGSAALLADSGEEPSVLRKNVTSPGGTTERIIATLDDANLDEAVCSRALDAAVNRANEIAAAKD
jgi:pyrroline-5-carboxylate reductase